MFISEEVLKGCGYGLHTVVHSLTSLPASDCNYQRPLREATVEELEVCLKLFDEYPKNNGSRKAAVTRELKKRKASSKAEQISLFNLSDPFDDFL